MKNLKFISDATDSGSGAAPLTPAPAQTTDAATNIGTTATAILNAAAPFAALAGPDGQIILAAASGALAIYKALLPKIQELIAKGEITPEAQALLAAAYDDVANTHAKAFQGAEWKQD